MTETKIRRSIFILIGLTVLILIGMVLGWFFVLVRPQKEKIAEVQGNYEKRKSVAEGLKNALDNQQKAEDKQRYVDAQLAFFRGNADTKWQGRYRTFRFDDIGTDPSSLSPEQKAKRNEVFGRALREGYSEYGKSLIAALLEQANAVPDDAGVKLIFNMPIPQVDAPPKAPEDIVVPPTGLIKPSSATGGGIMAATVTGTFNQIKDYFNRINRAPILFLIGNVKVASAAAAAAGAGAAATPAPVVAGSATKPQQITASFTITPYMLATGEGAQTLSITPTSTEGAPTGGPVGEGGTPAEGTTPPTN